MLKVAGRIGMSRERIKINNNAFWVLFKNSTMSIQLGSPNALLFVITGIPISPVLFQQLFYAPRMFGPI